MKMTRTERFAAIAQFVAASTFICLGIIFLVDGKIESGVFGTVISSAWLIFIIRRFRKRQRIFI